MKDTNDARADDLVRDLGPMYGDFAAAKAGLPPAGAEALRQIQRSTESGYRLGWSAGARYGLELAAQLEPAKAGAVPSETPDQLAVAMAALAETIAGRDEQLAETLAQVSQTARRVTRDPISGAI